MEGSKFSVTVVPYKKQDDKIFYCIFKQRASDAWQFVEGSCEAADATPLEAAKKAAYEIAHIPFDAEYEELGTMQDVSAEAFLKGQFVMEGCPVHQFAVEPSNTQIIISDRHTCFEWVDFQTAVSRLENDDDKIALRVLNGDLTGEMYLE